MGGSVQKVLFPLSWIQTKSRKYVHRIGQYKGGSFLVSQNIDYLESLFAIFVSLLCSEMVMQDGMNVFPSFSAFTEVLVEPKFVIPEGTPFTGGWCRPQNDGPGLRSITCMAYASKKPSLNDRVWSLVKPNLEPRSGKSTRDDREDGNDHKMQRNMCIYIYIYDYI